MCYTFAKLGEVATLHIICIDDGDKNLTFRHISEIVSMIEEHSETTSSLNIYINSMGGSLCVYLTFAEKLIALSKKYDIILHTFADPYVCSSAILLWLCADKNNRHMEWSNSQIIFHNLDFVEEEKDLEDEINNLTCKNAIKYVSERTGTQQDIVSGWYSSDIGYLRFDRENAHALNLFKF